MASIRADRPIVSSARSRRRIGKMALRVSILLLAGLPSAAMASDDLEPVLACLSRVAKLYRDEVLSFACIEKVKWSGRHIAPGSRKYSYVYSYSEDGGFQDRRFEAGPNALRPRKEVDIARSGIPRYLRRAFLWVFLFRDSRQPYHKYERIGHDTVFGQRAVMISFEPRLPIREEVNDWYGTAWVDVDACQLLKIEAYAPESWHYKRMYEQHGNVQEHGLYVETVATEFGVQKNGMRFPSTVEIVSRSATGWSYRPRNTRTLRVRQTYDHYEFFRVRTEDEVSSQIMGVTHLGGE